MTAERVRITVSGAVQGVGFRPHVHRLASSFEFGGFVRNRGAEVEIEVEGMNVRRLLHALQAAPPTHAAIDRIDCRALAPAGERHFYIAASVASETAVALPRVQPDLACCADCLRELRDPADRHYRYPFTNCSQCGPRYSIIVALPYDRANTTMAPFTMCVECRSEYEDPCGRRFHAQPNACPACGPRLALTDQRGTTLADGDAAVTAAAALIAAGKIVALKGLGGYQLLVDARNPGAIAELRRRKRRPDKPLAVMVADIATARRYCHVDDAVTLLSGAAAPIVLLERNGEALPDALAPRLNTLGVMLPATPLHHLLLEAVGGPVVCTSGNRAEEPICIDDSAARTRLAGIADVWLSHDRAISRALDDSVARLIDGAPQVLRVGRGFAPVVLDYPEATPALACGGHLKNTVAIAAGGRAIVSQHLGDLEHALSIAAMHAAAADLRAFHGLEPAVAAVDLHPDYASDGDGPGGTLPRRRVQHHLAHALAVMLEHELRGPLLAVVWDGSGLGADGRLWGGEFLVVERRAGVRWRRCAALRDFSLPGGDVAARDPTRALSGLSWEIPALRPRVPATHRAVLERAVNAPRTSSAGRLFDGVAALLGFAEQQSYEGQAATRLEHAATGRSAPPYPLPCVDGRLDWAQLLLAVDRDRRAGVEAGAISARFHASLAHAVVDQARAAGLATVILTGGCFQNRLLSELCVVALRTAGFEVLLARRLPPHDGALAAGQLVGAVEGVREYVPGCSGSY